MKLARDNIKLLVVLKPLSKLQKEIELNRAYPGT